MLIEGATVVTVNAQDQILDPGWIRVRDGRIVEVSAAAIAPDTGEERYDLRGHVVTPGLINTHTHLYQVLFRGLYDDLAFTPWLTAIYGGLQYLSLRNVKVASQLASIESAQSGVTTVVDHQFLNRGNELALAAVEGIRSVGLRTVVVRTIMDKSTLAPLAALESIDDGLGFVAELAGAFADTANMVTIMTGANTPGVSASADLATAVRLFSEDTGIRRSSHVAESADVVRAVRDSTGHAGVVSWLNEIGGLGADLLAPHSVHVSEDEIKLMAEHRLSVAHNPVSNMFLGDGIAPVTEFLSAGVNVALGTDGAASNHSQDMFEVIKATALLQRLRTGRPDAIDARQLLRMATINGAKALGLDAVVGSIEVGKQADLTVVALAHTPNNEAIHDLMSALVYSAKAANVKSVMVDGQWIMRDRELLKVDASTIVERAQEEGRAIRDAA